jgi:hypothetical protein
MCAGTRIAWGLGMTPRNQLKYLGWNPKGRGYERQATEGKPLGAGETGPIEPRIWRIFPLGNTWVLEREGVDSGYVSFRVQYWSRSKAHTESRYYDENTQEFFSRETH